MLTSDDGSPGLYVQPFPPSGARWQISAAGGRQPMWRRDGGELFFVNDDRKFYAVDIRAGQTFDYGEPRVLFEMQANVSATRNSYVPSRDGRKFLINTLVETSASPITVVLNWLADRR